MVPWCHGAMVPWGPADSEDPDGPSKCETDALLQVESALQQVLKEKNLELWGVAAQRVCTHVFSELVTMMRIRQEITLPLRTTVDAGQWKREPPAADGTQRVYAYGQVFQVCNCEVNVTSLSGVNVDQKGAKLSEAK